MPLQCIRFMTDQVYREEVRNDLKEASKMPAAKVMASVNGISMIVMPALAIIAVIGSMSGQMYGYCLLGGAGVGLLVTGYFRLSLPEGHNLKIHKITMLLFFSSSILFGVLGVTGVLSGFTLGWIIVGPMIPALGLLGCTIGTCCCCCCCCHPKEFLQGVQQGLS